MTSRDRTYWIAQAKSIVAAEPQIQELTGIEAWFLITYVVMPQVTRILSRWVYPNRQK